MRVVISQCTCVSNRHVAYLQFIQLLMFQIYLSEVRDKMERGLLMDSILAGLNGGRGEVFPRALKTQSKSLPAILRTQWELHPILSNPCLLLLRARSFIESRRRLWILKGTWIETIIQMINMKMSFHPKCANYWSDFKQNYQKTVCPLLDLGRVEEHEESTMFFFSKHGSDAVLFKWFV